MDFGYKQEDLHQSDPDLLKIRMNAVKASVENRFALFLRRLVCEVGLDEDALRSKSGFGDDPVRFDAILVGVEEPTKAEVHRIAHGLAELLKEDTEVQKEERWFIYTDGGYRLENATGAWCYIFVKDNKEVFEDCGHVNDATAHKMETLAMLNALKRAESEAIGDATFISDDRSLIDMIKSGSIMPPGWYRGDKCDPVQELYGEIGSIVNRNTGFTFEWTKGHSGNPWNEACDSLCTHELWKRKGETQFNDADWTIYTNGFLKESDAKGHWGYIAVRNGVEVFRRQGSEKATTLQEMELVAILKAMDRIESERLRNVKVVTTNKFICDKFKDPTPSKGKRANTRIQNITKTIVDRTSRPVVDEMVWANTLHDDPWIDKCAALCGRNRKG